MHRLTLTLAAVGIAALPALAQQSVSPTHKHSWSENCGWMDWAAAGSPAGTQSARIHASFLSGFVWMENAGWINLGDGAPDGGGSYANTTGADSGVNLNPATGHLSGMAWGENIGWINFAAGAAAGSPARIESARLRGHAWSENTGWITFEGAEHYVGIGPACYANCDQSVVAPVLNVMDFSCFLNKFAAGDAYANCDQSTVAPVLNVQDFSCFLNKFAAGCP